MIIKFSWGSGRMRVDPVILIHNMQMTNFRKWAKLFMRWAEPDQKEAFCIVLRDQIREDEAQIGKLESEVNEWELKAARKVPTVLATQYCRKQAALVQKHLNGAQRNLKRHTTMREILRGCFDDWTV